MKLASHLWQSNFGVYYLRYKNELGKDVKKSLRTKNPKIARRLAYKFGSFDLEFFGLEIEFDKNGNVKTLKTDGSQQDNQAAIEIVKTIAGAHTITPQQPQAAAKKEVDAETSTTKKIKLERAIAEYFEFRKTDFSQGTIRTYRSAFATLSRAFPRALASDVTSKKFVEFRQALDTKKHPNTIKRNCIAWKALFDFCIENNYASHNPIVMSRASAALNKQRKSEFEKPRSPFDCDDLNKIFDANRYSKIEKPCAYWLPLLALYTGARISDLCEIEIDDVNIAATTSLSINSKKTGTSRVIPLHPLILEVGFLDYVNNVKSLNLKSKMLFPHLKPASKNGFANLPGRDFSKLKISLGLGSDKVFHSFRSTLISTLQYNGCAIEHRQKFVGHLEGEQIGVHERHYSKSEFDPQRLAELIFPYLDYKKALNFELDNKILYKNNIFNDYLIRFAY